MKSRSNFRRSTLALGVVCSGLFVLSFNLPVLWIVATVLLVVVQGRWVESRRSSLRHLERLNPTFCHALHPSGLEWQLRAPVGVRLLKLWHDHLAAPHLTLLGTWLVADLRARGVRLEIVYPPLLDGTANEVYVTAFVNNEVTTMCASNVTLDVPALTLTLLVTGAPPFERVQHTRQRIRLIP